MLGDVVRIYSTYGLFNSNSYHDKGKRQMAQRQKKEKPLKTKIIQNLEMHNCNMRGNN